MPAKKWFGPRVYCPRCEHRCDVQVTPAIQEWGADGAVSCRDLECGYSATVGVFYGEEWQRWERSTQFKRNPVPLAEGQTRETLVLACPKCQGLARVRTSLNESPFLRLLYIFCESCDFRGKAYLQHLELLRMPSGEILREIPLHPRLKRAYQDEYGYDPERWRKHDYDGTRTRNARLAGAARAGHWNC